MEATTLFNLLDKKLLPYYEKLQNEDPDEIAKLEDMRKELEKALTDEQLKLSNKYKHSCALREESIEILMQIRILNYGVKIGMELQKAFDLFDDE